MSWSSKCVSLGVNTNGRSSAKISSPQVLPTALVDILLLKRRAPTFTLDCTDAFHQAPELDDVVVEPPEEYLSRLRVAGKCTNIWWKLGNDGSITSQVC